MTTSLGSKVGGFCRGRTPAGRRILLSVRMRQGSTVLAAVLLSWGSAAFGQDPQPPGPAYTAAGLLQLPGSYREWIFLSAGFDMSYRPDMKMGHHMFDNVFVNPGAYRDFLRTGTWPDKTMLVLEIRRAQGKGSINVSGNYQDSDVVGVEVHVKDEARFPGSWAFFAFGGKSVAKMIDRTADCYSCHAQHAALDTTFVQFYPTLLPIAQSKGTLSPAWRAGNGGAVDEPAKAVAHDGR